MTFNFFRQIDCVPGWRQFAWAVLFVSANLSINCQNLGDTSIIVESAIKEWSELLHRCTDIIRNPCGGLATKKRCHNSLFLVILLAASLG